MPLKQMPAGEFVMGDVDGYGNEYPTAAVKIEKPFWIGATEVSLAQYQQFDRNHRNGYYDMHYKDQVKPGYLDGLAGLPGDPRLLGPGDGVLPVAFDAQRQEGARCRPRRSGNGPAAPAPRTPMFYGGPRLATSRRSPTWPMPRCRSWQSAAWTRSPFTTRTSSGISCRRKRGSTTARSTSHQWGNTCPTPGVCRT